MLNALRKILQEVNSAHNIDEGLLILVQRIREVIEAQASAVFLVDRRFAEFVLLATKGYSARGVAEVRIDLSEGLLGVIAHKKEPLNLNDARQHPLFDYTPALGEDSFAGFIGVPIVHQRRLLGVIVAQKKEASVFSSQEESFLITLSARLAGDIAKAESTGAISQLVDASEQSDELLYSGVASSPGVGIGQAVIVFPPADLNAVPYKETQDIDGEIILFREALTEIREEIIRLNKRLETSLSPEDRALFDAYLLMLDDHALGAEVEQEIQKGQWAQSALCTVIKLHVRHFENMDNVYLQDRAEDVRDLGQRILSALQEEERKTPDYPDKVILIGEEVTAADLAAVPMSRLMGVVSATGSSNSHVAILARSLGVPAIMGVEDIALSKLGGKRVILDGYYGHAYIDPSDIVLREFQRLAKEEQQLNEELKSLRKLPAETTDGHKVAMLVNTGLSADLGLSLNVGAEGVGLYRSEIPFLAKELFPNVQEQQVIYKQLLTAFAPRPVTMRTLDIGGDKALPYFPMEETNSFLGWRGIRFTLDHPELFLMQIHAMLRASVGLDNLRIMLPMISDVGEVEEALGLIHAVHTELLAEGCLANMPEVGVMIEVPSALYQIGKIARKVDFLSIGSNDLTQYLLAVDRNNPRVANRYDSFHPSVLMALEDIVKKAHKENVPVTICGEMAGDPVAVLLLLGMGFDGLSMSAARLSRIKWVIRQFSFEQARNLYKEVIEKNNATLIRNRLELELENAGLGGLIRAGRH